MSERFLFLLKPDSVVRRQAGVEILKGIHGMPGLKVMAFQETLVPRALAELHYTEHASKPFFNRLVNILTNAPGVVVVVLEGPEGAIARARAFVGPTIVGKAKETAPDSLRGKHGLFEGINGIHCSDSPVTGTHETELWCGALGLTIDPEQGEKNYQAYVDKWDGVRPENMVITEVANAAKDKIAELKKAIAGETDLDDATIKGLLNVLVSAMVAMS